MEFRIERAAFAEAVAWAGRVLPSRTPVPVLGGLLLAVDAGRLTVSGFDFEAAARRGVSAETTGAGEVLVPGRRLLDICRVLPDGPVSCALEGTRFTVEAGGTEFGLSTLPREEYPALPPQPSAYGSVDAAAFATAVGQVAVAAGRDETLPVLTGVQVRLDGDRMTLSASDRYRYAVRRVGWKPERAVEGSDGVVEALIPARRLLDTARALARCGVVRIGLDAAAGGGLAGFEGGGMRTVVRLLDGRLPKYGSLFDMGGAAVAEVECGALTEAVRRVAVVAEASSPVRLDFSADGSVLLQAGYGDDVAAQRLPAVLSGAQEVTVAFNPAYLLDALNSFEAPRLRLEMLGTGQRTLLSAVAGEDGAEDGGAGAGPASHRHLLMSVKQLV
ncbi:MULTISPECIES: DNA polymerase III subunit beta [unclassified Streptomyces]|uniref:DNA polymerase III subunit beta n=1 Tax=unclassified Streptomyces TaxID=2593676 RepID=UPI002365A2E5|nr:MULTISPECIES: DNA polymerase III subunit beta [unclassified Streptomyces]MDF3142591.1 DNA polymerase III subunit beta [Streptomyces sp. T21Q-yed]WDF40792.1 DNA polymerase III subunit beta [Streptomyces sp. T12]